MAPKNTAAAGLYDESVAEAYDADPRGIYTACYDQILAILPERPYASCLDVGVGTGTVLRRVVERFSPALRYGLDPSESMLSRAAQKVPGLIPVRGDSRALETEPRFNGLDLILANFIIAYTEPPRLFASLRAAVADDGFVVITTSTMRSFEEFLRIGTHPIFRAIASRYDISPETLQSHLPPNPRDPEHLAAQLKDAGLRVVDQRVTHHPLTFKDGKDLYEFGLRGGWWVDLYKRLGITEKDTRWMTLAMRTCQLLRLIDRNCTTSMETCVVLAQRA